MQIDTDSVWVCAVCGKLSYDKYGDKPISYMWDVSCAMNSVLCKTSSLVFSGDRVIKADPVEEEPANV
jgi:hypothetical protein